MLGKLSKGEVAIVRMMLERESREQRKRVVLGKVSMHRVEPPVPQRVEVELRRQGVHEEPPCTKGDDVQGGVYRAAGRGAPL